MKRSPFKRDLRAAGGASGKASLALCGRVVVAFADGGFGFCASRHRLRKGFGRLVTTIVVVRVLCIAAIALSAAIILYLRGVIPTLNTILEIALSAVIGIAARVLVSLSPQDIKYAYTSPRNGLSPKAILSNKRRPIMDKWATEAKERARALADTIRGFPAPPGGVFPGGTSRAPAPTPSDPSEPQHRRSHAGAGRQRAARQALQYPTNAPAFNPGGGFEP
jgi:hypothetical protein